MILSHCSRPADNGKNGQWFLLAPAAGAMDMLGAGAASLETGARAHIASRILEAAAKGDTAPESLKQVGRDALHVASTMLR
ncbi:hypothetical protein [Bradyrhizobium sp. Leo121]|uniref:hypothetical protein n=1 Tax=Bradyrhizobium sp. Leo121 TaxID=1571195 RepID=UPI001029E2B8|nr:hypothetical protein [Bradyrhizobium sp. Leo121]